MASNIKDGSNYIDGVPVKISTRFLPPNPVTIPLALDTKFSTDLLAEQYDFSLERKIIEHHANRLLELQEAKSAKSAKTKSKSEEPLKETPKPQTWHSNTILQPSPQQPMGKSTNDPLKTNDTKINLSDFENDTSSPFDYMELQTINDLEELNSVFQGINDGNVANGAQESSVVVGEASAEESTVAKSLSFPSSQKGHSVHGMAQTPWPEKIPSSHSEDFSSGRKLPGHPTNGYPISFYESSAARDTVGYSTLSQVPYIPSNARPPAESSDKPSLRGSKSYSDIRTLSDAEVTNSAKGRSRTPPSYCPLTEPAAQETLSLNEDHFAAPLNESSNGDCRSDISAYEELDDTSRRFVDSLTEMGFPQGQVARAVKHLGADEKKVVEHLCQIQALEESGYESSEAEAALHLHDYNRDQAKEFLDLVNQFQDLGFEKDAVKKALVQNKNDWNKTIDALLP